MYHTEQELSNVAKRQLKDVPLCVDKMKEARRTPDFQEAVNLLVIDSLYWADELF